MNKNIQSVAIASTIHATAKFNLPKNTKLNIWLMELLDEGHDLYWKDRQNIANEVRQYNTGIMWFDCESKLKQTVESSIPKGWTSYKDWDTFLIHLALRERKLAQ
jgi:hypothetical protein